MFNDIPYNIGLWDTNGSDDYDKLRHLSYSQTDFFILCYSIVNPSSFERIKTKWIKEIHLYCPNIPIILVGNKSDLRNNTSMINNLLEQNLKPITKEQGKELVKELNLDLFLECSAYSNKDINNIFISSIKLVPIKQDKKSCYIM